ncbi:transposase [Glaciimonas sp. GNP009]
MVPTTFMMGTTLNTELKPGNRKGRPNYPVDFKRRLAAAACEAGVSVSKMAMANGVNANMAFKWRREFRAGLFGDAPQTMPTLLPVVLVSIRLLTRYLC